MNNLGWRIISGLLGAGILISAIVFSPWTFAIVIGAIMVLSLLEFFSVVKKAGRSPFEVWAIVLSISVLSAIFLFFEGTIEADIFWSLPMLFAVVFVYPLFTLKRSHSINCLAITIMAVVYISLPLILAVPIGYAAGSYDYALIMGILFIQWANDSGAYFTGKAFGKRKLFEKVSPKKTWEGAIGGVILGLVISYVLSTYYSQLTDLEWLGLALIIGVFGTIGDLIESQFKRTLAIKDSSNMIPGHGGFLDRFDSLFLALPFSTAYIHLVI